MIQQLDVEKVRAAFSDLGDLMARVGESISVAFGKCSRCNGSLVDGQWLKWCGNRKCQGYVGIK